MLTNGEIDSLAREVLSRVLEHSRLNQTSLFADLQKGEDGSLIPIYEASQPSYGGFSFSYHVLPAIKKIVSDCDSLVDDWASPFPEPQTQQLQDEAKEHQVELVRRMANVAALQLVVAFRQRLCETVEDAVEESLVISRGLLAAATIERLKKQDVEAIIADARPEIEKAVERSARKRRDLLRTYLKLMPNILTARGRGAPAKSATQRETERREYIAKVQDVYRDLYVTRGQKPKKTLVAKTLGEGGINPRTGSDSSLQAFNLKLKRLQISYDDVVRSIDEELNNNS